MSSKPLVIRYDLQGIPFALQFLAAEDFDVATLKRICKELEINQVGKKNVLLGYIESFLTSDHDLSATTVILYNLIRKAKKWFTFKQGKHGTLPSQNNPADIIYSEGKEEWYGPINLPEDPSENWYIRQSFILEWEIDTTTNKPIQRAIRWLLFAKVTPEGISYHWQGFSHSEDENSIKRESQFRYWDYVPNIIKEFEAIVGGNFEFPNLYNFVLHQLWDNYRGQDGFTWTDQRIRAESGGVSLNARSAGVTNDVEIDVRGINSLANTLTLSVIRELGLPLDIQKQHNLQEKILRTIIREFGAKSYEFSLEHYSDKLIRAHIYFGAKPNFPGPDSFPHINCIIGWKSDQDQLNFIVNQLKTLPENVSDKPFQPGLL